MVNDFTRSNRMKFPTLTKVEFTYSLPSQWHIDASTCSVAHAYLKSHVAHAFKKYLGNSSKLEVITDKSEHKPLVRETSF